MPSEEDWTRATGNIRTRFGKVWPWGFQVMWVDRQTDILITSNKWRKNIKWLTQVNLWVCVHLRLRGRSFQFCVVIVSFRSIISWPQVVVSRPHDVWQSWIRRRLWCTVTTSGFRWRLEHIYWMPTDIKHVHWLCVMPRQHKQYLREAVKTKLCT